MACPEPHQPVFTHGQQVAEPERQLQEQAKSQPEHGPQSAIELLNVERLRC
jgi:hypothetical protein